MFSSLRSLGWRLVFLSKYVGIYIRCPALIFLVSLNSTNSGDIFLMYRQSTLQPIRSAELMSMESLCFSELPLKLYQENGSLDIVLRHLHINIIIFLEALLKIKLSPLDIIRGRNASV